MKGKNLIYWVFVIAGSILIATFVTATTYYQLVIASLFYPPIAYFLFKSFPTGGGKRRQDVSVANTAPEATTVTVEPLQEPIDVSDTDKRAFLKLIGSVGLSLFIFSIFTKRSENVLFGKALGLESGSMSLQDVNGKTINPAEQQPTDGYQICEIDESDATYFGYTNNRGNWYIMKQDLDTGSFRYSRGENNFPGNWDKRANLTYDYFYNVFSS